eukprot:SAG31_NODE_17228_length_678_cov_1.860104_1_plen_23_part_10
MFTLEVGINMVAYIVKGFAYNIG